MKALVTGASGFLGGALVRRLVRDGDHKVVVLARRTSKLRDLADLDGVEIVYGDLADEVSLARAATGVDVVFHSAARVDERGTRDQFWAENVRGTQRLLESARRAHASRFVFISSPSALMDRRGGDQLDIDESVPYPRRYLNLYSETKAAAERSVLAAATPDFVTCALRPRAIWGAGDRTGPIVRLLGRTAAGTLPDLSFGRAVYASLCHVDNIVDACVKAAASESVGGKAYFIADAERTNVWEFLAEVAGGLGYPPPSRRPDPRVLAAAITAIETAWRIPFIAKRWSPPLSRYAVALLTRSATYDTSAAARDFGYEPIVDRDRGLAEFLAWLDTEGGIAELTRDL
ncbi:NAD-dependent epimerase/dehydratase family protein [Nocardia terpenica]|uniref:NAD-dependent epimerase/dehydratase family protein n=1 Tax=Nocardia terpenica TaxID=455432 RepID=UPI001895E239|nr:NAD-dependent epimerase/dehydratase family protein [Nocardia terpenica]MBF6063986.1 NAD-dependent epimerase/dehydratase family protein [Nocardia terpenica]MBF6107778.1 NAD-dependent epimerase/dehydratase family protein [Nocardia terpenica]MBF6114846.1 NAD-dependent epimerase/dehydratase family protein [Nocardia terpenica]MBF6121167.1 NAD-dependent epimerase/dehydratase family protein [Nocardia terpenica]MBF6153291.1 NAD-dependent epimerase/dehydratase family protein [Nocardia terpenica]